MHVHLRVAIGCLTIFHDEAYGVGGILFKCIPDTAHTLFILCVAI